MHGLVVSALAGAMLLDTVGANPFLTPTFINKKNQFFDIVRDQGRAMSSKGFVFPPDQWFNQTLDHYNALNQGFWEQRYWVNESFFDGSGPLFLYVEGEGSGSPIDVVLGQHVELAAQHGALIISLEHRFYGASIPTPDQSEDSLAVLSSHQSIGDIAVFIKELVKSQWPGVTQVVTFGGSYPGALSAWIRLRLPHLVSAAFSTSSPVEAIVDFVGYNDVVAASLSNPLVGGSDACLAAVSSAFAQIDAALRGSNASRTQISKQMYSCEPALSANDVMWMASNLASVVMGVVQYNMQIPGTTIASMCTAMVNAGPNTLDAFAGIVQANLNGQSCMDNSYDDFIAQLRVTANNPSVQGVGIRQWTWQTCTEFAYYQSCEAGTQCPFSTLMTLDSNFQICVDGFDARVGQAVNTRRVDWTNDWYGGNGIAGSRILFTNGGIDPWHNLSVLPSNNLNPASESILIPSGSHCRQMQPSSPTDPDDVKAARALSAEILSQWLASPVARSH